MIFFFVNFFLLCPNEYGGKNISHWVFKEWPAPQDRSLPSAAPSGQVHFRFVQVACVVFFLRCGFCVCVSFEAYMDPRSPTLAL